MKLVLLTAHTPDGEPQHRFVAHHLAQAFPHELAAIVVATGVQRSAAQRVRRILRKYSYRQILSRLVRSVRHRLNKQGQRRDAAFNRIFFPQGGGQSWPRPDLVRYIAAHNSPECLALLDELRPDIIVTYGTLIIRAPVIARAACSTINMHTGVSPTYRGSDTIFWPLHNAQPEFVGVTIHRVDTGVDSGAILHIAFPAIAADDDEDTLFAKAVAVGAPLLAAAAREEFEGKSHPLPQDLAAGREYRSVERTLGAERRVRALLADGLLRRFAAPSRETADAQ